MARNRKGPTFRRAQLGKELRRLRDLRDLSLDQVARDVGVSRTKLTRVEGGDIPMPRIVDLERLLDRYEVEDLDDREFLVTLHKESLSREPWHHYRNVMPSGMPIFVGLEQDAREIKDWVQIVVPGLLQTEAYTRQLLMSAKAVNEDTTEFVERNVQLRVDRKEVVTRTDNPVELRCVMSEAVLLKRVGDDEVMRGQLREIEGLASLDNVTVQILPLDLHTYRSLDNFIILDFGGALPPVAATEHGRGMVFTDRDTELWAFNRRFEKMRESALAPEDTPRLLAQLLREKFS